MTGFFEMRNEDQTIEEELKNINQIVCHENSHKNYPHIRKIPPYLIVNSDSTSTCIPSEIIIH